MRRRRRRGITSSELTRALDASYRHIAFAHPAAEEDQLQRELDDIAARSMKIRSQKRESLAQRGTRSSRNPRIMLRSVLVNLATMVPVALLFGVDQALKNASGRAALHVAAHWIVLFGFITLGVATGGLLLRTIVVALASFRAYRRAGRQGLGEFLTTFRARRQGEN